MARAEARRAQPVGVPCGGPTQDGVRPPAGSDEEGPRIYARDTGGADLDETEIADIRDYVDSFDWATVSPSIEDAGFRGADVAGTWLGARVAEFRKDGRGGPLDLPRREGGTAYVPYVSNEAQRFQISITLWAIRDWVEGAGRRITKRSALSHRAYRVRGSRSQHTSLPGLFGLYLGTGRLPMYTHLPALRPSM